MIYLVLAVASSAMVSIVMRISENHVKNKMAMFMVNYAMCLLLARGFMGHIQLFTKENGVVIALGLGLVSGVLYLLNFILLQKSMSKNGVVLSSTFMKLGVLVPTILAVVVFGEMPRVVQVVGILFAIVAIVLVNYEKEDAGTSDSSKVMLIVLLLVSGITDSMANIYDKTGVAALKDHYLFYTFLAALLVAGVLVLLPILRHRTKGDLAHKEISGAAKITGKEILFGVLLGIPNYFASRFLLLSLEKVPAVITYPVYSVATIVVIMVVSLVAFKERLSKRKLVAMGLIVAALVLLNI